MKMKALVTATVLGTALTFSAAEAAPAKWTQCAKCHGDSGKGDTKMGKKLKIGDMSSAAWQKARNDADMSKTVRGENPKVKHKAFKADKLSDKELAELIKHIRSLVK